MGSTMLPEQNMPPTPASARFMLTPTPTPTQSGGRRARKPQYKCADNDGFASYKYQHWDYDTFMDSYGPDVDAVWYTLPGQGCKLIDDESKYKTFIESISGLGWPSVNVWIDSEAGRRSTSPDVNMQDIPDFTKNKVGMQSYGHRDPNAPDDIEAPAILEIRRPDRYSATYEVAFGMDWFRTCRTAG
ncbi:hypothetical protein K440DRAFT_646031 [Wilcoxina mikolae CBS 423.85]|nr:hypothetical protein K440DRAFT_646031 [Wilcoxina mikolae CBS 423.85]